MHPLLLLDLLGDPDRNEFTERLCQEIETQEEYDRKLKRYQQLVLSGRTPVNHEGSKNERL